MTNPYLSHPDEEALERFLLRRSDERELEIVETHILACDGCVARLEKLESQLADLKLAFEAAREQELEAALHPKTSFWQKWLTVPRLSWAAGACAALAVALVVVPGTLHFGKDAQIAEESVSACAASDVNLASCRGNEAAVFPANRPMVVNIDTTDIAAGPVDAQVVDASGRELWHGQTTVQNQRARVTLPKFSEAGPYFLRLYAPGAATEHELLREYRFEVK